MKTKFINQKFKIFKTLEIISHKKMSKSRTHNYKTAHQKANNKPHLKIMQ